VAEYHFDNHMPLSPSQRISLIKEISTRFDEEEWPLVDLTLRQFKLPNTDDWQGNKQSYIIQMIDSAKDEVLLDLAQHLGYTFETVGKTLIEPSFWEAGKFKLFLSHLAAHRSWVGELQVCLLRFGISSFVAHNDIEPTAEWLTQIETALTSCEGLVALLHKDFHASRWTDQEIGFAMGRGVPVFSIRLGEDPYGFIGRFQAFQGVSKTPAALAAELFDCYRKNKQTQKRMSEVLIRLFENSSSFAEAKLRVGHLEDLEEWDPAFSDRILSAAKNNVQITESFGVVDRVKALVSAWK
jgi:hypothetical protein